VKIDERQRLAASAALCVATVTLWHNFPTVPLMAAALAAALLLIVCGIELLKTLP
jgi:hypothetical protein